MMRCSLRPLPKKSPSLATVETESSSNSYYRRPSFYILFTSNLIHVLAFYLPFIYLPSYSSLLGYSSSQGALVLAVGNAAQILGEIGFGKLSDKMNAQALVFFCSFFSSLSIFFLQRFAMSLAYLIAFARGFVVLWPRMGTMFAEKDASKIYSYMSCG